MKDKTKKKIMQGIEAEFDHFREAFGLFLVDTVLGKVTFDKNERDAVSKKEFGEDFHYALGFRKYTGFKFKGNDIELEESDTTVVWKDELAKLIKAKAVVFQMTEKAVAELVIRELKFIVEDLQSQFGYGKKT